MITSTENSTVAFTLSSLASLRIFGKLAEHSTASVTLRASTSLEITHSGRGVRVSIAPGWWASASSFTVSGLAFAQCVVVPAPLPASIRVVTVNHDPQPIGRLWRAAKAGDPALVEAAIVDGCSTEEGAYGAVERNAAETILEDGYVWFVRSPRDSWHLRSLPSLQL